uniref:Uncharacterized protein n=1 Tax=Thermofilum pendens TaxID=2269 RepID=A0A7J3X6D9_THEPE
MTTGVCLREQPAEIPEPEQPAGQPSGPGGELGSTPPQPEPQQPRGTLQAWLPAVAVVAAAVLVLTAYLLYRREYQYVA